VFSHAFKLAWRNLLKQRLYTSVILLSLALGLSICNLLITFVFHELRTDAFHERKDRIFRLLSDDPFEAGGRLIFVLEQAGLHLKNTYPEVEAVTRIFDLNREGLALNAGSETFSGMMVLGADSSFFDIFSFPFYHQAGAPVLRPGNIVLTKTTGERLFGKQNPIGETISMRVDTTVRHFVVSAVMDDPLENSHFQFDALVPFVAFNTPWGATHYVLLRPDADPKTLAEKISADPDMPSLIGPGKGVYSFQSLPDVYFDESQQRPYYQSRSRLLITVSWVVVGLVLFTAGFNFINLVFISQLKRRREWGVQKIFGASRRNLWRIAMVEVLVVVGLSYVLSLVFTQLLLPWFNQAFQADLPLEYFAETAVISTFAAILLVICLIFIFAISNYFTRLNPVELITPDAKIKLSFNRWMFTAQFIIAAGMIFCTVVIARQVQYINNKPLGFNRHLLELRLPDDRDPEKMGVLKDRLRLDPELQRVAAASGNPISGNRIVRYELDNGEVFAPYLFSGDSSLISVLGLEVVDGAPIRFTEQSGVLVNEQLVRHFGWKDAIGKTIPGTDPPQRVAGVVRDFNLVSLKEEIPPVIINYRANAPRLLLDYSGFSIASLLPKVENAWQEVFPKVPIRYRLVEEELLSRHEKDVQFFRIVAAFSLAAVLITCFGLFALAWGTTQGRSKEIGIRKVLGASPWSIWRLLILDYSRWILLAVVIALPFALFLMQRWLENFAFHATIGAGIFLVTILLVVLVTLFSVGFQTLRSARLNPVEELKYE
jgi:putative ABC transport system permease protein